MTGDWDIGGHSYREESVEKKENEEIRSSSPAEFRPSPPADTRVAGYTTGSLLNCRITSFGHSEDRTHLDLNIS